ncbi:chromosome partitioning protein ParB [Cereibacter changlensis JA139]|uniref:Chromosome partitioning protein ParB n=2 Tax=Cereibacter changlensis TaxID=402884 RepID=A0A2T4K0N2_9RHOB|nr:ParB N-terminal domain-containing protein [Cereibacter changlensis]PTE23686.1 chromosome partitioning protein ParB [Cereibacter changlensis JA139]PZX59110.1 ParB family chromosome partitioning protein [Cereibacter changlensis]
MIQIPLAAIDESALPRDRGALDPEALSELQHSIALHGLRQPIEVFETAPGRYALISGYRRLAAIRALEALGGRFPTIPAFLRSPATLPEAVAAMVAENDLRCEIAPWDKGRIAVTARNAGLFPTLDAAIDALYPTARGARRTRLRALATLAEELDGLLAAPETLSQRQCLRLATACRAGFADLIRTALEESRATTPEAQWTLLQPILLEADQSLHDETPYRPGHPRRLLRPRPGLTIRRELAPEGWVLRFTGPEATGMMMESVMDEVERMYGKP